MEQEKRITMKLKEPNPLFVKWITKWRDEAIEKQSKLQYSLNTALASLKKYPIPLETGRDCIILKGFGNVLCSKLDKKLREHKERRSSNSDSEETVQVTKQGRKRRSTSEKYIPQHGSGAYAILVALYKNSLEADSVGYMTKNELISKAQSLSDKSFIKPEPNSYYTAWSSMRTLITKQLVLKKSNPAKFSLTDEGMILARQLYEKSTKVSTTWENIDDIDKVTNAVIDFDIDLDMPSTSNNLFVSPPKQDTANSVKFSKALTKFPSEVVSSNAKTVKKYNSCSSIKSTSSLAEEKEDFILAPNSFDIILYVDTQETIGTKSNSLDPLIADLTTLGVKFEVKHLKVSDYAWVCRDRESGKELVLPHLVERKRMDDFAHSIKDGRYYEQKFRLKKSGFDNICYLIESYGNNEHVSMPLSSLMQAATNTAIQDGFLVKFTENLRDTAHYLNSFTKILISMYKSKTLVCCNKEDIGQSSDDLLFLMSFKEFNQSSAKNKRPKVSDLFVKMLIQMKGMSVDRALAIVENYPTPVSLRESYERVSQPEGEKLLMNIKFGSFNKKIGPVLSKTVYQLFMKDKY